MDIKQLQLTTELKQLLSTNQAWHYGVIPYENSESLITLLTYSRDDIDEVEMELSVILGKMINLIDCERKDLNQLLNTHYPNYSAGNNAALSIDQGDLFTQILEEAINIKSSDIHIEAYEQRCRVRFRIDGKMVERYTIDKDRYPSLINQLKIKSNLDISEKRLPQDGRIFFTSSSSQFDIRVSILPVLHGEKVVMRLLNRDATEVNLDGLGFSSGQLLKYKDGVRYPNGIILISGPTGSGKTTTLYATLKHLNRKDRNILTIEDPIEYILEGINQVQLKESIGLTFGSTLRTFLRQDPDIIMIGEIRDQDTAQMAVRAALTGHLVLSTIHTNSALGTISRLIDMGVPPYLLASTMRLTVAQRLIRVLCPDCKREIDITATELPKGYTPPSNISKQWVANGCGNCFFTGYRGRKALYEIISIDNDLVTMIKENRIEPETYFNNKQIITLSKSAFNALHSGETSLDEVWSLLS